MASVVTITPRAFDALCMDPPTLICAAALAADALFCRRRADSKRTTHSGRPLESAWLAAAEAVASHANQKTGPGIRRGSIGSRSVPKTRKDRDEPERSTALAVCGASADAEPWRRDLGNRDCEGGDARGLSRDLRRVPPLSGAAVPAAGCSAGGAGRVRAAVRRSAGARHGDVPRRWLSGALSAVEPRRERQAERAAPRQGHACVAHRRLVAAHHGTGDDHLR